MPNPVCPVVKDLRLKSLSEAMWSPSRLTLAPMIRVSGLPAFSTPLAVPVVRPPPAWVLTMASGGRPASSSACSTISMPRVSMPAMEKGV